MTVKLLLCFILCILSLCPTITHCLHLDTYIIQLSLPNDQIFEQFEDQISWYHSYLPNNDPSRIVHTYRDVITGFAARLSPDEVKEMEKMDGFLYATPHMKYTLHTTHTPSFLGLVKNQGSWQNPGNYGKGVTIGLLDGGITPDHPSFNDKGMPSPPSTWKGQCESSICNNKLIGTRNLIAPSSDIYHDEHGTHTASTAAGNFVENANVFGQANGTASGMAPLAHVAMYQVCSDGCSSSDILAGLDGAIQDKCDVVSISLGRFGGGGIIFPFYADVIAQGAFRAMQKGITVVCSAGNSGPGISTLSNEAPWIMTVGASSPDRKILATAALGNGDEFDGESLNQTEDISSTQFPLIYQEMCYSFDGVDVKGKIVVCDFYDPATQGALVKSAGGAAMILANVDNMGYSILLIPNVLPVVQLSHKSGQEIKAYISSTSHPTATIVFKGTILGDQRAPTVAYFSSRGPNLASPGILKPDITAPGLNILAAYPYHIDDASTNGAFHILSGTSMSCPHISGVAALVKSANPTWTPAMIKSAIMTSATQVSSDGNPIVDELYQPAGVFSIGAGHVNPSKAMDPGLVYDISPQDYVSYLCFLYSEKQVEIIVGEKINCQGEKNKGIPEAQLNYPSISISLGSTSQSYSRTVTNVGEAKSTYRVQIESVTGVNVTVKPRVLSFTETNEKKTYTVYFNRNDKSTKETYVEGAISWVSAKYKVRIPVSVKMVNK